MRRLSEFAIQGRYESFVRICYGKTIAVIIHSLNCSLFTHLSSVDRSLSTRLIGLREFVDWRRQVKEGLRGRKESAVRSKRLVMACSDRDSMEANRGEDGCRISVERYSLA